MVWAPTCSMSRKSTCPTECGTSEGTSFSFNKISIYIILSKPNIENKIELISLMQHKEKKLAS